jgi:HPt (histidine-containing phosphotransfer) domain-containing protein
MNQTQEERVAAARARMAELKEKFVERSHGDVSTLRRSLAALEAGDCAALGTIEQLAHRMSGTGATLGFESLGERAQRLEQLAGAHARGSPPDAAALSGLAAAIEALAAELARCRTHP